MLLFCSFEEIRQRELAAGAGVSIKFADGCGLLQSDTAGDDFGSSVTLRPDRNTGCTAQHRKLTDVRQRVGQWTLDEHLGGMAQRSVRSKKLIERSKTFKEPPDFRIPIAASLRTPEIFALCHSQAPGHEVAQVLEDLHGRAGVAAA